MNKKTARTRQYSETASNLYLAFELGAKSWKLAFTVGLGKEPRIRNIEPRKMETLEKEIAAAKKRFYLAAEAKVVSCYEAGRDGFWLHRYLVAKGIENLIVDSSSIEVNRRKRRAKTDRLDAQKLVRMLVHYHAHDEKETWHVVRVPSPEEEDRRQVHRERAALKKEIDRTKNRIRGLLAAHGIRPKTLLDLSEKKISGMRIWDGSAIPQRLKKRIQREWEHVTFLLDQLRSLERERRVEVSQGAEPDLSKIEQLQTLKSIGPESSWVIVREFFGWRQFKNRRELGALSGLTGTPYESGEDKRDQGISKAGNRHVRRVAVELAWSWTRYQPNSAITQWYMKRFAKGGKRARKIGIVAVARKLLIALWEFVERGVVPEGAELKAHA